MAATPIIPGPGGRRSMRLLSLAALLAAAVLGGCLVGHAEASSKVKVTSLLANDAVLDRYAAAVAATEPLREDRDRILRENINPLKFWWMKTTKGSVVDADMLTSQGPKSDIIRKAYTYHVVQSGRIIKSMGLSIADFNTITRRLAQDPKLRQRVLKQAYLYRLESRINDKLLTSTVEDEDGARGLSSDAEEKLASSGSGSKFGGLFSSSSSSSPKATAASTAPKRHQQQEAQHHNAFSPAAANAPAATATPPPPAAAVQQQQQHQHQEAEASSSPYSPSYGSGSGRYGGGPSEPGRLQLFAKSLREIERLRAEQTEHLRREYAIDVVPDISNRPELLNLLDPKVQQICRKFPLQAEEIAVRNGFQAAEFDALLTKARKNPLFRWRVNRLMGQSPASGRAGANASRF